MASYKDFAVNDITARTVYPTAGGASLGVRSTAYSPFSVGADGSGSRSAVLAPGGATTQDAVTEAAASSGGFLGQPVTWWVLLLAMLYGVRFIGAKLGSGEEFKSLKVSVFNIVTVSLMSIVGIGLMKVLVNRFRIPGLTPFINAV